MSKLQHINKALIRVQNLINSCQNNVNIHTAYHNAKTYVKLLELQTRLEQRKLELSESVVSKRQTKKFSDFLTELSFEYGIDPLDLPDDFNPIDIDHV